MTTNEIKGRTIVLAEESDSIVDKICTIAGWEQFYNLFVFLKYYNSL